MRRWRLACGLVKGLCLMAIAAPGHAWLDGSLRHFEELRLAQLRTVQEGVEPVPFTTDGCSGNLSRTWDWLAETLPGFAREHGQVLPWASCCESHDKVYWSGPADGGYDLRLRADEALRQCVDATGDALAATMSRDFGVGEDSVRRAFSMTAELMYRAVRIGGQPCSLLPWRWGYGWPHCAFARPSGVPEEESRVSDVEADEQITFFATAGWLDPEGQYWHLPLHAWVYKPQDSVVRKGLSAVVLAARYGLRIRPENEQNFSRRINLMYADNERGRRIFVRIAGQDLPLLKTRANGHSVTDLRLPANLVAATANDQRLHFFALLPEGDERRIAGDVLLIPPQGFSVISDIDDTVKESEVGDRRQLLDNTFYRDFRAVPGMPALYRQLAARSVPIHFVSSSPWQLYQPLQDFAEQAGFPPSTMSLKMVRFRDRTLFNLFKSGTATKPEQIEAILRRYPQRQFVLIGDSGEQDPEVYGDIARRFAAQIHRVLIRHLEGQGDDVERYLAAFREIPRDRWQLFRRPEEIAVDELLAGATSP